jgi:hypothetical protein
MQNELADHSRLTIKQLHLLVRNGKDFRSFNLKDVNVQTFLGDEENSRVEAFTSSLQS